MHDVVYFIVQKLVRSTSKGSSIERITVDWGMALLDLFVLVRCVKFLGSNDSNNTARGCSWSSIRYSRELTDEKGRSFPLFSFIIFLLFFLSSSILLVYFDFIKTIHGSVSVLTL
jgi:hypothetical protein